MAPAFSKLAYLAMDFNPTEILRDMKCYDEVQQAMVRIENDENPDSLSAVADLCCRYLTGEAARVTNQPMWLCAFSFNSSEGTAWPMLSQHHDALE